MNAWLDPGGRLSLTNNGPSDGLSDGETMTAPVGDNDGHVALASPWFVLGGVGNAPVEGVGNHDVMLGRTSNSSPSSRFGAEILIGTERIEKSARSRRAGMLIRGEVRNDSEELSALDDLEAAIAAWATDDLQLALALGSARDDSDRTM